MVIRNVAVFYDDRVRSDTTGLYCRRALGQLVEVEHFLPTERERIPDGRFDLYLQIDGGLRHVPPDGLRPRGYRAIDTHLDFDWHREVAPNFDLVFTAQRDGAERLRAAGIRDVEWLPLACDPEMHAPLEVPKEHDICFVGTLFDGVREDLLGLLRARFPATFAGRMFFEDMARAYSAARIVFNRSIKNDVNMRVFEAPACGAFLLTNDLANNGQRDLFEDGVHHATYRDPEELLDKAAFYLQRADVREKIARAGREHALAEHTYRHRMERVLAAAEQKLARCVVQKPSLLEFDPSVRPVRQRWTDPDVPGTELLLAAAPEPPASQEAQKPVFAEELSSFIRSETRAEQPSPADCPPADAAAALLALIPITATRILDLGCGTGRLGEAIKSRQTAEIVGIERDPPSAQLAQGRLDRVLIGDVEVIDPDFAPGSFDTVICGEVLQDLHDPCALLKRARTWLSPDGVLVVSVTNIRHHRVVDSLLRGDWTYDAGVLLGTPHLCFFTRREIEKLLFRGGFGLAAVQLVPGPGYQDWLASGRPGEVRIGRLHIGGITPEDAEEFFAARWLLAAKIAPVPDLGLTSIVIVTHGQVEDTRQCIESIRKFTDEDYELICIDNASRDATAQFLRTIPRATVILNDRNVGFAAAVNQGIAVATGQQVLLLNPDIIVTTGWLARLLKALKSDPKVGLVGPSSNRVSGPQQVPVTYEELSALDGFAWSFGKQHDRELEETDRLVGFCLLIRRETIDSVGLFDEQFEIGCFEDDDYCLRADRAGYRCLIARGAFVHHWGGRSFSGSGADFAGIMARNGARFRAKWGLDAPPTDTGETPAPAPAPIAPAPLVLVASSGGGLLLQRQRKVLSVCIIARDNARTIRACIESVLPWADEVIVNDTGSVDDTPKILAEYGVTVIHTKWVDSFSVSRNLSIDPARGQLILVVDTDDTLPWHCGMGVRRIAYSDIDPRILGFVMQVHCPGDGEDDETLAEIVDHVKVFRNRPNIRYDRRIHEHVLGSIRAAGGEIAWTDLYVVHSGSDHTPEGKARKIRRDLHHLDLEDQEAPNHPFTLFNKGMTYGHADRPEEAADCLVRSIAYSDGSETHLRKAYALLLNAQMRLKRYDEARETCRRGRQLFPMDLELCFRQGVLMQELGCPVEAVRAYREVFDLHEGRHFASAAPGLRGFLTRQNMAAALTELGDLRAAEEQWRAIIHEVPRYRAGWRGLGQNLLRKRDPGPVNELCLRLSLEPGMKAEEFLLTGRLAAAQGDHRRAISAFDAAIAERPADIEIRDAQAAVLIESGDAAAAERVLTESLRLAPDEPGLHHNLAGVRRRSKRYKEAIAGYRESIRLRPDHAVTWLELGWALKDSGRAEEAVAAFEEVLRLKPGEPQATAELDKLGKRRNS
jgi:GT2 family glycosyltransferase/tetratricopeptide (TPR) repeat protein